MILSHGTVEDVAEVSIDFRIRFFVGEPTVRVRRMAKI
jgi:hypothetical protein